DDGYTYGGSWLHRELPEDFEDTLDNLLDDIDNLEEERKGDPLTVPNEKSDTEESCNAFWEMIEEKTGFTGRDAELCAAFIEMFGLCENDLEDIKINETNCEVQGVYYLAGTDDEMDSAWDDELENYLDECVLPDLPENMRNYFDRESWIDDAKQDGRAHVLNRYDGCEESCQINGTWYYCYRQ
ncbi:MAG: antirestriction protein ArdA, partial [Melioribacteraceae bacterium]|nr:antirestriction protein ArdA [Melioribacteraceae bacterium]